MHLTLPIKRVLVAVDFSDLARTAFYAGLSIATKYGADTWVLHVSEPIRSFDFTKKRYVETKETIDRVEEGVRRRIDELWDEGGLQAVDRRKINIVVRGGKTPHEIVELAKEKQIDIIVLGAGGSSVGQASGKIGSTSERVVRDAPCCVFCVRLPPAAGAAS